MPPRTNKSRRANKKSMPSPPPPLLLPLPPLRDSDIGCGTKRLGSSGMKVKVSALSVGTLVWVHQVPVPLEIGLGVGIGGSGSGGNGGDVVLPAWPARVTRTMSESGERGDKVMVDLFGLGTSVSISPDQIISKLRSDLTLYQTLQKAGRASSEFRSQFCKAMEALNEFEEQDGSDDELPSLSTCFKVSPPAEKQVESGGVIKRQMEETESDTDFESLKLPVKKKVVKEDNLKKGQLVLAKSIKEHRYHPGRIVNMKYSRGKFRYEVEYWYDKTYHHDRAQLMTPDDEDFDKAVIVEAAVDEENGNEDIEDDELRRRIIKLEPLLRQIYDGKVKSDRYDDFLAGGKRKISLDSRTGRGPFSTARYHFIGRVLNELFADKATWDRGSDENTTRDVSQPTFLQALNLVNLVLLPETVIRLIMEDNGCLYRDAEDIMYNGSWVSHLISLHQMAVDKANRNSQRSSKA